MTNNNYNQNNNGLRLPETPSIAGTTRRERLFHDFQSAEETARLSLLHGTELVTRKAKGVWNHFLDFIDNGNVIGLAVGLIIGAAFTGLVNSLVDDIIAPPLGVAVGQASLDNLFVVIKEGKNGTDADYTTLQEAIEDGAVCVAYGRFVQNTFNFFIIAWVLFLVIKFFQVFQQEEIIKSKIKCPFCRAKIPKAATRCQFCTSWRSGEGNHPESTAPQLNADGYMSD